MAIYVGCKESKREVFTSKTVPTEKSHGIKYAAVVGPFHTRRGAIFMRDHGADNPHVLCVQDAERIAALPH